MITLLCALSLAAALAAGSQKAPSPAPAKIEQPAKALIQGRIINAATRQPVPRATLLLMQQGGATTPIRAESDENGAFEFRDLDAGKYLLYAVKQGFARQAWGSRGNPLLGATLTLAAGEEWKGLLFSSIPDTVIAGRVFDEAGDPVANIQVMALRSMFRRGKREYIPNAVAQTNDLGEYRLAGLGPGSYIVLAVNRQIGSNLLGTSQKATGGKPQQGPVNTYYPNSTDIGSAAPVEATSGGAEVRGIDIRLAKAPVGSVKGKLTGIPVPLSRQLIAWLTPKGAGLLGLATRSFALVQMADGAFEFKNVAPGSYILTVTAGDGSADAVGALPLEIGEEPLDNVQLTLGPGPDVTGRLIAATDSPVSWKGTQVLLEPQDMIAILPPRSGVAEDGSFTLKNVPPDRFLIQLAGAPEHLYVQSIRYGNQEILESGFDASLGVAGRVEVRMAADGAVVEGTVTGPDEKPLPGALVALIPDNKLRSRYKSVAADQRGAFSLKGVAPGNYRLLAWEVIETGAHEDPDFVKAYESKAERVSAKENARLSFQLKAIPAPAEERRK